MIKSFSPLLSQLIDALRCLPGVGPKSAQRMAFHLLSRARDNGLQLSVMLQEAMNNIDYCEQFRTFSEKLICAICQQHRDEQLLCIVENPTDILALEHTAMYRGYYFVLHGHLSPLDGIGPDQLGFEKLIAYVNTHPIKEIIIATNPTVEGEATAHYIAQLFTAFENIHITRIAHGVPFGGELEFIDGSTLARAMQARTAVTA